MRTNAGDVRPRVCVECLWTRPSVKHEAASLKLRGNDGKSVDAQIEIEGAAIILHSRGGKPPRNTQYSKALDLILGRLATSQVSIERVLVDSTEAQQMSDAVRTVAVAADFSALVLDDVRKQIRRRMRALGRAPDAPPNKGNSTKRLRIETSANEIQLRRILRAVPYDAAGQDDEPDTGRQSGRPGQASYRKPTADEVAAAVAEMPITDEERRWIEGNIKVAKHLRRERHPGLADAKKKQFGELNGRLFCERCSIDPVADYGTDAAVACIEVHHAKTTVADMDEGHETSLEDLQCLCANCHRLVHREMSIAKMEAQANGSHS